MLLHQLIFGAAVLGSLFVSSAAFLIDQPSATNVYRFNFTLTWELSMLYTDQDDVQWVSVVAMGQVSFQCAAGR